MEDYVRGDYPYVVLRVNEWTRHYYYFVEKLHPDWVWHDESDDEDEAFRFFRRGNALHVSSEDVPVRCCMVRKD